MEIVDGNIQVASAGGPKPPEPLTRVSLVHDLLEAGREIVRARDLLYELTLRDVRIRYKQAVMGFGWALFMPVLIVLAGCLVRLALTHGAGGTVDRDELAGLAVKSLPWAFVVGAIGFATPSLTNNMNLVSKVYFPREVLPLASLLAQSFDSTVGVAVLTVVLLVLGTVHLAALVWVPVLAVLLFLLTAAACLFLSCANLFFRDVKYIVQVMVTFGIFVTPVLFEPGMLGPTWGRLIMLNPLAPLLEGLRLSVVRGHDLLLPLTTPAVHAAGVVVEWSPWWLVYTAFWATGGLLASALLFHRSEAVFAEYV